jgi:hypothetical protein
VGPRKLRHMYTKPHGVKPRCLIILPLTSLLCPPITVFQCCTNYRFSVAFRHICQFAASPDIRFFCFITLPLRFPTSFRSAFLLTTHTCTCEFHKYSRSAGEVIRFILRQILRIKSVGTCLVWSKYYILRP